MLNATLHRDHEHALTLPSPFPVRRFESRPASHPYALCVREPRRATASDVALHEAGHAVCLLASGYAVARVEIFGDGSGRCVPAGPVAPRVLAVVSAAGPLAEAMERGNVGYGSTADDTHFTASLGSRHAADVAAEAVALLRQHRAAVEYLAAELDARGSIAPAGFRELCHRPGSPLRAFAGFYPVPPPAPARQLSASRQSATVARGGIF